MSSLAPLGAGNPQTFRPRWARRVIYPVALLLVASCAGGAVLLPENFKLPDRLGVAFVGLVLGALAYRLAVVRIETDDAGLTVVNFVRQRRLSWPEVVNLRLGRGDPWVVLDLAHGDSLPAMGIQGSDGEYARNQARQLGQLVAAHSRTEHND